MVKARDGGCERALCLLVVFSSPQKPVDEEELRLPDFVGAKLFPKGSTCSDANRDQIIDKVLRISTDDRFGRRSQKSSLLTAFFQRTIKTLSLSIIKAGESVDWLSVLR